MSKLCCIFVVSVLSNQFVQSVVITQQSQVLKNNDLTVEPNVNYNSRQPRGWKDMASNAIAGPAGQLVVHFAKEMMSRQDGSSQVKYFFY